jgi:hypothetical protein
MAFYGTDSPASVFPHGPELICPTIFGQQDTLATI